MAARHGGAHCSAFRHWKCPQLGQGREHIMFSPLPKLWALPMSESGAMGAAVFFQCDSRPLFDTFCLENLSVFSIHQKMEQNPTYNWADLIHFRDEFSWYKMVTRLFRNCFRRIVVRIRFAHILYAPAFCERKS